MSVLEMSEEEKNRIRKTHEDATKAFFEKKNETKKGLQPLVTKPEPKVVPKKVTTVKK